VFHVDLLTPYKETATYGSNYTRPPPDLINGEEEYEVERIINSRQLGRGRQVQYLVKWKGYPDLDNQWVKWQDIGNAPDLIAEYQKENPNAITHIRRGWVHETTPPPSSLTAIKEFIGPSFILLPISHLLPHMSDNVTISHNVTPAPYEDAMVQHSCNTFCRRTHIQGMWRPSTPPPILPRKREHNFIPTHNWTNDPNPDTSGWDVSTPDYDFDMSRPPSPAIRSTGTTHKNHKASTNEEHWWGNSNGYAQPSWGKENSPWPRLPTYQKLWKERDGEDVPYWIDEEGKALCDEPEEVEKKRLRAVWWPSKDPPRYDVGVDAKKGMMSRSQS